MIFNFDERESDSSLVERIWRTHSERSGSFISTAAYHWEMVFTKQYGKTVLTLRGPETRAKPSPIPDNAEFFGITFKLGTFMPDVPVQKLVDDELNIHESVNHSVALCGDTWEIPTFDNTDTFIQRLVQQDLLVYEPIVDAVLNHQPQEVSLRTVQRRFLRATGIPYGTIEQIERAKQAVSMLQTGVPIPETAYQAGYADQPHLTRSLKRYFGRTPTQFISDAE